MLEHLYLYLPGEDELKKLAAHYANTQEFFKALESTYISKILSGVRMRIQKRNAASLLTFRDLSEGEQQLLMVLGLLRFTKEEIASICYRKNLFCSTQWSGKIRACCNLMLMVLLIRQRKSRHLSRRGLATQSISYHLNAHDLAEKRRTTVCNQVERLLQDGEGYLYCLKRSANDLAAMAGYTRVVNQLSRMLDNEAEYSIGG